MATIVRNRKDQRDYILVGTGFGAYQSERGPSQFGEFSPSKDRGNMPIGFISDSSGNLGWLPIPELEVISIDGMPPLHYLPSPFTDPVEIEN